MVSDPRRIRVVHAYRRPYYRPQTFVQPIKYETQDSVVMYEDHPDKAHHERRYTFPQSVSLSPETMGPLLRELDGLPGIYPTSEFNGPVLRVKMRYREPLDVFVLAKVAQVISKHFDSTKLEFQKSKKKRHDKRVV